MMFIVRPKSRTTLRDKTTSDEGDPCDKKHYAIKRLREEPSLRYKLTSP